MNAIYSIEEIQFTDTQASRTIVNVHPYVNWYGNLAGKTYKLLITRHVAFATVSVTANEGTASKHKVL